MKSRINDYIDGFVHLFFPCLCLHCSEVLHHEESFVCFRCISSLEPARIKDYQHNEIIDIFAGRVPISYASVGFKYHKKGILQNLIFHLKYHRKKKIGQILGKEMAFELKNTIFAQIDYIIPVPLHPKRQKKRGYNQAEWIAKGIAEVLNIPLNTKSLQREKNTDSQTEKSRIERFENVRNIFNTTDNVDLNGKHILLVDDILTTGSTIEACSKALLENFTDIKVSVVCLAKAD